jgi:hypothetical protein
MARLQKSIEACLSNYAALVAELERAKSKPRRTK